MKIDIDVGFAFDDIYGKRVKGVSDRDWEFLIRNVLKVMGIEFDEEETYRINVSGVREVYNKYEEKEYEFAEEDLFAYYVEIRGEGIKSIVKFRGINVKDFRDAEDVDLKDKLELVWRKFLILVKGNSFANVIVDEIKKQETRKIREIEKKSKEEINNIEDFIQTQKTVE